MTNTSNHDSVEREVRIVLMAGEPSGDLLGAFLMRALKAKSQRPIKFYGVGGALMHQEGLKSFFPLSELNVMGLTEVVSKIPTIWRRLKESRKKILELRPDVVVTIDFPGFNFKIAKSLKGRDIPLIHYVAPTVWVWREKRAKTFSDVYDHILALYPFEPDCFDHVPVPVTFVGHPLVEQGGVHHDGARFRKTHNIAPGATVLTVLPGSRESEVRKLLPIFKEAIRKVANKTPGCITVIPTVPEVAALLPKLIEAWPTPVIVVDKRVDKQDAYAASVVALASSGTVALEVAQAGLPVVIAYQLSKLGGWFARRLLKVPYVCMINILMKQRVVPECLQEDCNPERLSQEMLALLSSADARATQQRAGKKVLRLLTPEHNVMPSEAAADIVLSYIPK